MDRARISRVTRKRVFGALVVCALCALGLVIGVRAWFHELAAESDRAQSIRVGALEADVLRIVGPPDVVQTPRDHLWCEGRDVVREYMYGTRWLASWHVIGFDRRGRVVCTMVLQSP
jgi:hypothetical protein